MPLSIDQRKQRWSDLLNGGSSHMVYIIQTPLDVPGPRLLPQYWNVWPQYWNERVDWSVRLFEAQRKRSEWLDDDFIPYLNAGTGTEIFAEAIGCPVHRPTDNMPFALPLVHNAYEARKLTIPKVEDTPLMDLLEMARRIRVKAAVDAPFRMPDIQSPMDILAQVWDKTDMFTSMVDEPELVRELAYGISGLLTGFLDLWFAEFGTTYVAHHPDYLMQGGITMSVDEIGSVSRAMFDTFFLDELNRLSDHFGGIGIHCCANSEHHWPGLRRVHGLKVINLARSMDVLLRAFQALPDCVHFPWLLEDGVSKRMPPLSPSLFPEGARAILLQDADNDEEARCIAERLARECRTALKASP